MSQSERTRVDLTQMGIWGNQVRVELGDRYEEVWVQTLGDRTEALERGHEAMQRKLLEFRPGSERAEALMEALMLAPAEDVVELALGAERWRIEARVRRELSDPVRPRQDRAAKESDEDFARRMAAHENRCREMAGERRARIAEMVAARRDELKSMPRGELAELARPRRVDVECWNEFARVCDEWVLLRAVRRLEDRDRQYFEDISEVRGLHPAVKEQLRLAYRELEPGEGDELPKSSALSRSSGSTT
jgi:hypothetical protein